MFLQNKFKDRLPWQDSHSHLLYKPDGKVLCSFQLLPIHKVLVKQTVNAATVMIDWYLSSVLVEQFELDHS